MPGQFNSFKNMGTSPSGAFYFGGMDNSKGMSKPVYFQQYGPGFYPIMSPWDTSHNQKFPKPQTTKNQNQSPKVDAMDGVFQTPTSKGAFNYKNLEANPKHNNETGSFGASPHDISTTKAVFEQHTKFGNQKEKGFEVPTPNRQMNKEMVNPYQYFANSPAYGYTPYQNAFIQHYGNTPTGGSFGASPVTWVFNVPSPHTGMANTMTPFNQGQENEQKSNQQKHSPKFNSVSESNRQPWNIQQTGQDSARAFNANMTSAFNKMAGMVPNYSPSPAHAFSFSWVSGKLGALNII